LVEQGPGCTYQGKNLFRPYKMHGKAKLGPSQSSSNKMPAAVKSAIQDAVERYGGYSSEDAVEFIKKMVQEGRLIEECWS
jgi:hypothetical protein